jgi:hypothetical protein
MLLNMPSLSTWVGEMDVLGDRIIEQAAHIDAAMQRLLADIRAFDAHWLARSRSGAIAHADHRPWC